MICLDSNVRSCSQTTVYALVPLPLSFSDVALPVRIVDPITSIVDHQLELEHRRSLAFLNAWRFPSASAHSQLPAVTYQFVCITIGDCQLTIPPSNPQHPPILRSYQTPGHHFDVYPPVEGIPSRMVPRSDQIRSGFCAVAPAVSDFAPRASLGVVVSLDPRRLPQRRRPKVSNTASYPIPDTSEPRPCQPPVFMQAQSHRNSNGYDKRGSPTTTSVLKNDAQQICEVRSRNRRTQPRSMSLCTLFSLWIPGRQSSFVLGSRGLHVSTMTLLITTVPSSPRMKADTEVLNFSTTRRVGPCAVDLTAS
ncbi:hypothetical protein NMY22_g7300 [Coprinellus aureogranulatus]|nr:hypothetical protein NMY22_g7300 [Coprinellus aureogranulatus]